MILLSEQDIHIAEVRITVLIRGGIASLIFAQKELYQMIPVVFKTKEGRDQHLLKICTSDNSVF